MAKNISKDIEKASKNLKFIMQDNLSSIAGNMISQVMTNYRQLGSTKKIDATKNIKKVGEKNYQNEILTATSLISANSLEQASKEVPKAKNVKLAEKIPSIKLGEFEKLPPKVRNSLKRNSELLIGTQLADLEKVLFFQFNTSLRNDVSENQIENEMIESAEKYIEGNAINAGASVVAANVVNDARQAYFFEDEVLEEIDAFQFVNGDPVSPICNELAGTVFSKNDPNLQKYWTPLHYNCKSWMRPILKGNLPKVKNSKGEYGKTEKFTPSKAAQKSIQFSEIIKALGSKKQCQCGIHL